jgi:hypothetical protein
MRAVVFLAFFALTVAFGVAAYVHLCDGQPREGVERDIRVFLAVMSAFIFSVGLAGVVYVVSWPVGLVANRRKTGRWLRAA